MEVALGGLCLLLAVALGITLLRYGAAKTSLAAEVEKRTASEADVQRESANHEASRLEVLRLSQATSELEERCRRLAEVEVEKRLLSDKLLRASMDTAQLRAEIAEQRKAHDAQVVALQALRHDVQATFKTLAADSLRESQQTFLALANETFEKHKIEAVTDLSAKEQAVGALVEPVVKMLNEYQEKIAGIERTQQEAYGALTNELRQVVQTQNSVRTETARLVNALRAAPKTRGRWGEQTLRNVIELAGLSVHCDFMVEPSFSHDGALLRPDLIIYLPGGRSLVVDAKTALQSYLDAIEAGDDEERSRLLQQHATQLRNHAKQLGSKAYWDKLDGTPDFVVMFVPGDNFYSAAAERDPTLFEDAAAQRVLIVTPATLIALAKAVAYGWRQEKIAENTRAVHELGRDLYKRLITMGGHIQGVGKRLEDTVKHYNEFVGSLEVSVLPQARKFNELEVEGTTAVELPQLPMIEQHVKDLKGRDIVLPVSLGATVDAPQITSEKPA